MRDQKAPEPSAPASETENDEAGSDTEQASTVQIKRRKGYQVNQAETGGPAVASAVLQPLPAFETAAAAVLQPLDSRFQLLQPAPLPISPFCSWCRCQFCSRSQRQRAPFLKCLVILVSQANPQSLVVLDLALAHCC